MAIRRYTTDELKTVDEVRTMGVRLERLEHETNKLFVQQRSRLNEMNGLFLQLQNRTERLEHEVAELGRVQDNLMRAPELTEDVMRGLESDPYEGPIHVASDARDGTGYIVQLAWTCTCPAFIFKKAREDGSRVPCKHIERVR